MNKVEKIGKNIQEIRDFVRLNLQILNEAEKSKEAKKLSRLVMKFHKSMEGILDGNRLEYITCLEGYLKSEGYSGINMFYLARAMTEILINKWVKVGYSLEDAKKYHVMVSTRNAFIAQGKPIPIEFLAYPLQPTVYESKEDYQKRLSLHWMTFNSKDKALLDTGIIIEKLFNH